MKTRHFSRSPVRIVSASILQGHSSSLVFGVCAVLILSFSLISPRLSGYVRATSYDLFMPVISAINEPVYKLAYSIKTLTGLASLEAENQRLRDENIRLRSWYSQATKLQTENQSLRELLNVVPDPNHRYITARILSDAGSNFAKTLMVKAGKKQSVAKGQAVVSDKGLIGRVIETSHQTSRVLLVTDMNSRVPVYIEGVNQHAVMAGRNDATPALVYLPAGIQLKPGQVITTSGYGGVFPPGLPVGIVAADQNKAPVVRLYSDFNALLYVRIVNTD